MIEGNSSVPGQIIHTFIPAQNKMYEWKDLRALVLPGRTDFKKTKKAKSPYISKKKRKKRSYVWIFQVYFGSMSIQIIGLSQLCMDAHRGKQS